MTTSYGHGGRSLSGATRSYSGGSSSSDETEGEGALDNSEFVRNRKERSTVLVRRFFKNNQKVISSMAIQLIPDVVFNVFFPPLCHYGNNLDRILYNSFQPFISYTNYP